MRQYALSAARASCGTAEIMTTRGIFPQSGASWAFNLALTVITLGSWLVVWLCWGLLMAGETVDYAKVSAYPEGSGSRVDVESTNDEWRADLEAWRRGSSAHSRTASHNAHTLERV